MFRISPLALLSLSFLLLCSLSPTVLAQEQPAQLRHTVLAAMKRATEFYRTQVASHGGYVYHYSIDLQQQWGEGEATKDQIWVQPPGTPTVGLAFIAAYKATGDRYYLEAIEEVAQALIYGQLKSGGWTNCIDFDPKGSLVAQYRNGRGKGKNNSSLDDGQTQTAIRFMIQADAVFEFKNAAIHESASIALDALLAAQFPSGGFPQVWTGPVAKIEPVQANYPKHDYRTEGRVKNYWDMPTLNDNVCVHVAHTFREAYEIYRDEKYLNAMKRLGEFLLLAQMPEPQPAWAQQYNHQMQPIWARRFEPPAIAGHESQAIIELLIEIAAHTGDKKYLATLPQAVAYLRRSELPDGQIARYYELQTNRPLYMQRSGDEYTLTFDDHDLPSHYSWKTASQVERLEQLLESHAQPTQPHQPTQQEVEAILNSLDAQGRWISIADGGRTPGQTIFPAGSEYLSSAVFSEHLTRLSTFISRVKPD